MFRSSFCAECGTHLGAQTDGFCPYCGTKIEPPPNSQDYVIPSFSPPSSSSSISHFPEQMPGSLLDRFIKVLTRPIRGMALITHAPDEIGPIIIYLIMAFSLLAILFLPTLRTQTTYTGTIDIGVPDINNALMFIMTAFPLILLILTIILLFFGIYFWCTVFWILLAVFTDLNPKDRSFVRSVSIVGYAWIPQMLGTLITAAHMFLFYPLRSVNVDFNTGMTTVTGGNYIRPDLAFQFLSLGLLMWSLVLVYYALRSLEISRIRIGLICAVYLLMYFFL